MTEFSSGHQSAVVTGTLLRVDAYVLTPAIRLSGWPAGSGSG